MAPGDPRQTSRVPRASVCANRTPGVPSRPLLAAPPQPQAARGPHVVERERTETLVRDGQLRKDTQPIARLHVGADGGWDRIRRAVVLAAPASKRGAPPHH